MRRVDDSGVGMRLLRSTGDFMADNWNVDQHLDEFNSLEVAL